MLMQTWSTSLGYPALESGLQMPIFKYIVVKSYCKISHIEIYSNNFFAELTNHHFRN